MGRFWQDDSGAVSVDWVVLAAAVVGLAMAATGGLQSGTFSLADTTATAIQGAQGAPLGVLGYSQ